MDTGTSRREGYVIDCPDMGIRNSIDFHNFGTKNGTSFQDFGKKDKVRYIFS